MLSSPSSRFVSPYLFLILMAFGLVLAHTAVYPTLGPIDEQAHVDYIYKIDKGYIPRFNELMGQEALAEEACRGFDSAYVPPPCLPEGERYDPKTFQFGGASAAAGHPPVYYGLTTILAKPIFLIPKVSSLITAARLANATWLAMGACFLWALSRKFGTSRFMALGVILALMCTSQVLHAASTINPDNTAFFGGALMLWAMFRNNRPKVWLVALCAAFVVSLKATNILVIIALLVFVLIRNIHDHQTREQKLFFETSRKSANRLPIRIILAPVLVGTAAALAILLWQQIMKFRALPVPADAQAIPGTALSLTSLFNAYLPVTQSGAMAPFLVQSEPYLLYASYMNVFVLAVGFGGAIFLPRLSSSHLIATISSGAMIFGPLVTMCLIGVGAGAFYSPPTRYGLSLLPMIILPLFMHRLTPRIGYVVGLFGYSMFAVTVWALIKVNIF